MASTINASTSPAAIVQTADGTGILALQTGNTTAVTIDASQNVGIGTASPSYALDVQSATTTGVGTIIGSYNTASSGSSISTLRMRSAGTGASYWDINTGNTASGLNGSIRFFDNIASAERMRIDSSGNVGIGTASPATKLEVDFSNAGTTIGSGPVLTLKNTSYTNSCVTSIVAQNSQGGKPAGIDFINVNQVTDAGGCSGGISFWTQYAGTKQYSMNLDYTGSVLFNNAVSTVPWTAGSGATWGVRIGSTYTFSVNNSDIVGIFNRTTSTGTLIEMKYNAGVVGSISVTGSATAYNTSSDYRLKENIAPMTGALNTITQLKPVTYKWKFDGSDGQGFIAHELAEVVPDCVSGEKDAVDEDGNIKPQGIDTSFLVATLTAAIQEQQALITSLTARITALEGA